MRRKKKEQETHESTSTHSAVRGFILLTINLIKIITLDIVVVFITIIWKLLLRIFRAGADKIGAERSLKDYMKDIVKEAKKNR